MNKKSGVGHLSVETKSRDNGGRRSGFDLRQFSYTDHIPERRLGQDRRCGPDRRSGLERRSDEDRRRSTDVKEEPKTGAKIIELRNYKERRLSKDRRASDRLGG